MPKKPKRKRLEVEKHIPAEVFRSVGLLITVSASAEFMMADLILRLIGTKRGSAFHAYPLVAGMDVKVKISLIRIYAAMYRLKGSTQINETLDKIDSLLGLRNEVAHSATLPGRKKGQVKFQDTRAKARLKGMPQPTVRNAETIREAACDLHAKTQELLTLMAKAGVKTAEEYAAIDREFAELLSLMAQIQEAAPASPASGQEPA
jgi:hypothetical protein